MGTPHISKRPPPSAGQGTLLALLVGPLRPFSDRRRLEAVVGLPLVPHRKQRGGIKATSQQLARTVNQRLAGAADDDFTVLAA